MRLDLTKTRRRLVAVAASAAAATLLALAPSQGSDHADTAENANRPGADLSDVFVFPSATDPTKVVLAMNVHPLIPTAQAGNVAFDTGVLYQFKIDNTGDYVEDLVIQAKFSGNGPTQQVAIAGPMKPLTTGTTALYGRRLPVTGTLGTQFSPTTGMTVFAGPREDPFFFDLDRFFKILPDRATPLTGMQVETPNPDTPQLLNFRGFPANFNATHPGQPTADTSPSMDFLAGFNLLSIVIELPRSALVGQGNGKIGLWCTTSVPGGAPANFRYVQQERLSRPVVNEVFATVSGRRHEVNNKDNPTDDPFQLAGDIQTFVHDHAGRSQAITDVIKAVIVPDVMKADLSVQGEAAYLGLETGGATSTTGSKFGGRKLTDDVVDISLMVVFGTTVPDLGLAPDDHMEILTLATNNTGFGAKHFLAGFPYLGNPR